MSWSKDDVYRLVDLVRRRPCLYDNECESFRYSQLKHDVAREIASIISSTRPGTTVEDVFEKWNHLCTKFAIYHKKLLSKRKSDPKHYIFDKMDFMRSHLNLPIINPISTKNTNKGNKDITNQKMTENDGRLSVSGDKFPCLELPQVEISCDDVISDVESDPAEDGQARGYGSSISIHSDNSPAVTNRNPLHSESNRSMKRKYSAISLSTNATIHDISGYTLASPLVNVNDTILDRTEPFPDNYLSFRNGNSSHVSRTSSSPIEDEDMLYAKYIACKLKKLDASQKLKFKLELEKLFYDNMN